jgi:hypothetical protein
VRTIAPEKGQEKESGEYIIKAKREIASTYHKTAHRRKKEGNGGKNGKAVHQPGKLKKQPVNRLFFKAVHAKHDYVIAVKQRVVQSAICGNAGKE